MRTMVQTAVLCLVAGSAFAQSAACPVPVFPLPTGQTERPGEKIGQPRTPETFVSEQDYKWMHSSTNLQGYATTEKFAPCVFFDTTERDLVDALGGFQSALVLNNPSPTATATVNIELFDRNGNAWSGNPLTVTLQANENWAKGLPELQTFANGVGSARITSNIPIVGATQHYIGSVVIGGTRYLDPDPGRPGEGTMQQLQAPQPEGRTLYAGPIPLSNSSQHDFLNGNLPFQCMMNTSRNPTNITIYKGATDSAGTFIPFPTRTRTLPGFGIEIDMDLWNFWSGAYANPFAPIVDANGWSFVSSDVAPLVGESYMADFFAYGSPTSPGMSVGKKFRVGSAMMANKPSSNLTSAEVTQQSGPSTPGVDTMIGLLNASTVDIAPVTITYRSRDGVIVGTQTVNTFLPGQALRLGRGTPGFPAAPFFDGWADIRSCKAGLIGWTMREISRIGGAPHYEKAYGEELAGANTLEPGKGIPVIIQGTRRNRKVVPLARVSDGLAWPSYSTFANNTVGNIGNYWFRSYEFLPTPGEVTDYTQQPFVGLQFGRNSFTYQDGANSLVNVSPFNDVNISSRVDITNGSVIGMTAIGDPLREWEIIDFPALVPPVQTGGDK
ncbi:MAG: hypothetical protein KA144_02435 [Xanthomonadaceae bacterium]|nr:hypothetical protein [Xanthomonadaceae bacterium]